MVSESENQHKLQAFFKAEYQQLKAYVGTRLADAADREAEDVVQDVALKMFSRADDLVPITNVAGFVYRALRNRIIDLLRTKKKESRSDEELDIRFGEFVELFYGKATNTYPEQMITELKWAIGRLKPYYQEVIIKIDIEGLSYREMASAKGISEGTLMSRRHRALGLLQKDLEKVKHKTK